MSALRRLRLKVLILPILHFPPQEGPDLLLEAVRVVFALVPSLEQVVDAAVDVVQSIRLPIERALKSVDLLEEPLVLFVFTISFRRL